jgi:hypothetical protein
MEGRREEGWCVRARRYADLRRTVIGGYGRREGAEGWFFRRRRMRIRRSISNLSFGRKLAGYGTKDAGLLVFLRRRRAILDYLDIARHRWISF